MKFSRPSTAAVPFLGALFTTGNAIRMYFSPSYDITQPIQLKGDATFAYRLIENLDRYDGLIPHDELGWPNGSNFWDFPPVADSGNLAITWLLAQPFDNPFLIANLFFLSTFTGAFLLAYLLLRNLSTSQPVSMLLAIVFAFLPYHQDKHIGHLYLSNYAVLLLPIWLSLIALRKNDVSSSRGKLAFAALIGFLTSLWGIYYAIFSLCYLGIAAVALSASWRRFKYLSCAIIGALVGLAIQTGYVLQRQTMGGTRPLRLPEESDLYALKPVLLLTPSPYGVINEFVRLHDKLQLQLQFNGEATASSGVLLAVVALISIYLLARSWQPGRELPGALRLLITTFALLLILFSTIVPSLLGLLGLNEIRVWSRSSILVSTLLLFIAANLLDTLWERRTTFPPLIAGLLAVLPVLGAAELIFGSYVKTDKEAAVQTLSLSAEAYSTLIARVQSPIVFQLPHVPFPEHPDVERMKDYDHFIPTLLGHEARWSYGKIRFSGNGKTCMFPSNDFVECLRKLRFNTVWIDTYGYVDGGLSALQLLQDLDHGIEVLYENERYIVVHL